MSQDLKTLEMELSRLYNLDKKLIAKADLYQRKLDACNLSKKIKEKKLAKFNQEYHEMRLKVGKKRVELMGKKLSIIGYPKSVKINEEILDYWL